MEKVSGGFIIRIFSFWMSENACLCFQPVDRYAAFHLFLSLANVICNVLSHVFRVWSSHSLSFLSAVSYLNSITFIMYWQIPPPTYNTLGSPSCFTWKHLIKLKTGLILHYVEIKYYLSIVVKICSLLQNLLNFDLISLLSNCLDVFVSDP